MALTLVEAAKLNSGDVQKSAIIEMFAKSSDILRVLPIDDIQGSAMTYNREETLPGVGFRGVNEAYSEDAGIINPLTEALKIAGGDLDVDLFILKTMGMGQRAVREQMKVKALAGKFTKVFLKGDSISLSKEFDGLQVRLTGDQLLAAGATSGGDALSLLKLDEVIDKVDNATHLIMNKTMRRLLTVAARTSAVGGNVDYDQDEFGRRLAKYNDLPILIADEDNTGTQILPFTEANPGGGTAASTSIYCCSFSPGMLSGIQNGTMDVRDLGELDSKSVMRTRVEWFVSMACYHGRAAARLHGIKNATVTV